MAADTETVIRPRSVAGTAPQPLAPSSPEEIARTVAMIRGAFDDALDIRFETIELYEPEKGAVWSLEPRAARRIARANIFRPSKNGVFRLKVALDDGVVVSNTELPDARPMIQPEQFLAVEEIVRRDPAFVARCARRGITDMSLVCMDPWSAYRFGQSDEDGKHVSHVFAWQRLRPNENFSAHPIEGLNAVVNLKTCAVIRADDYGVLPAPQREAHWDHALLPPSRAPMKPINVVQPEGVSFRLDGRHLTWDKWSVVVGFNAREVLPGVAGHIHQHIFCARLDMAVDGARNSVVEGNTYAEPAGSSNPYGNAFYEEEAVLRSEREGARRADPATHRSWTVINPSRRNHAGTPVGYRLHAPHCVTPFVQPDAPSGQRAGFVQNHFWVTAFDAEERYPVGEYMNQSDGSGGLPDMIAQNRNIENADLVVWHVFGLHHPIRVEDFPVQPAVTSGFKLMPFGFFDGNPCIDLPPERNAAACHADAGQCPPHAHPSSCSGQHHV